MARDFNQFRNANAILKGKNGINSPGVYYAVNDNADGYFMIEVSSLPSVELFIGQGTTYQTSITEWTLFNSQEQYGGIGANAFEHLPNLDSITIWQENTDTPLTINDNAFETNVKLEKIYVHHDLLARYQSIYAGKSFVSLFASYELVTDLIVPTSFDGNIAPTTLTKNWLDLVFANMPTIERNAKTTLIVPDYFISIDSGIFSGLETRFINLQELKCNGTKTFNAGFLNGASWCIHLWLDNGNDTFNGAYVTDDTTLNANFRTLAPYLVFANYFMSEYPNQYLVVGYNLFESGNTLPQTSPTGEYLWFSNINFDANYNSPTGLENDPSFVDDYEASSSGYYYCYDKTTTLVIQGSGTLTSAIVESAISGLDTPLSWITKVVVPNTFTNVSNSDALLVATSSLTNLNSLEIQFASGNNYNSLFRNKDISRFDKIILDGNNTNNCDITFMFGGINAKNNVNIFIKDFVKFGTSNNQPISYVNQNIGYIYIKNCTQLRNDITWRNAYLFVENGNALTTMPKPYYQPKGIYVNANLLVTAKTKSGYSGWTNQCIGVIDGNNIYQDKQMQYPKLTGIDTEANIQLLTPADNSLYLASDTGNLWQYSSGTWTNLFANLLGITWYSDEDCTTSVLPSAMDTSHTYYVKGTAFGYDFANDSWANIKLAYERGVAHYNLGDTKTITYNNATYTIRICDLGGRYDITNGNGAKNKATFEFVELVGSGQMNTTDTNSGGFASSVMQSTILPSIYNNFPSDLKAVISQVEISSFNGNTVTPALTTSSNYLFLTSSYELTGQKTQSNEIEQTTIYGLYANGVSTVKKDINGNNSTYWLRSPANNTWSFCYAMTSNGQIWYQGSSSQNKIPVFFCI